MEPIILDAHKDLLLCVYYELHTKGTLHITYEDVQNFEKNFTSFYNELNKTESNFVFTKKELETEIKQNYELLEHNKTIRPKTSLKQTFLNEFNALDYNKKHIVNQMIIKTLSNYDMKQIISMQKRKHMVVAELIDTHNIEEKAL